MTDETVNEAPQDAADAAPVATADHAPALRSEPGVEVPTVWNRFLSPLVVPIAVVGVILFFVLGFSRMFLAAEGSLAVIIGTVITISILVGASMLANSRMKGSSLAVVMIGVFFVVGLFGMVSIGDAEPEKAAEVTECTPVDSELAVTAGPGLKFDKKAYEVTAGCVDVLFKDVDAAHNITWDAGGPQMPVLSKDGEKFATAMTPGEYTFFCSVAGHRGAGMEATVTVSE